MSTPKPKPAASDTSPEFNAFRDFARKVLTVPKAEVDKREAAYQRKRAAKKARRANPG